MLDNDRPQSTRGRLDGLMVKFENALYGLAFFLLICGAMLVVLGIVPAVMASIREDEGLLDTGILAVDRVLIIVIIAELGSTLRTVIKDEEIIAEPFLIIGLIAIVRRILILSAELEDGPQPERISQLLFELGGLSVMVLAIGATILLLRTSAHRSLLPYLRRRAAQAETREQQAVSEKTLRSISRPGRLRRVGP